MLDWLFPRPGGYKPGRLSEGLSLHTEKPSLIPCFIILTAMFIRISKYDLNGWGGNLFIKVPQPLKYIQQIIK